MKLQENQQKSQTLPEKQYVLTELSPKSQSDVNELLNIRNNERLRGIDIVCSWGTRSGILNRCDRYGEQYVLKWGGLQSRYITEEQLRIVCKTDKPVLIKNKDGNHLLAAYICGSDLHYGGISEQEKILLENKNCAELLYNIQHNAEQESALKIAKTALQQGKLLYLSNLLVARDSRGRGLAKLTKTITYKHYIQGGFEYGLFRIFSIDGIYRKDDGYIVYQFSPQILNEVSLKLNRNAIFLGVLPTYIKLTDMTDSTVSPEITRQKMREVIERNKDSKTTLDEKDEYLVKINNLIFLDSLEDGFKRFFKDPKISALLDKCELNIGKLVLKNLNK